MSLPPPRALAPSAAVSLCRYRSVSADSLRCTPCTVLQLLPDLFVLDRASSNAKAHLSSTDTTRDGPVPPRLSHEAGRAKLTPRGLRSSCQVRSPDCFSSPSLVLLPRVSILQSRTTCSLSSYEPPGSVLRELAVYILFLTSSRCHERSVCRLRAIGTGRWIPSVSRRG